MRGFILRFIECSFSWSSGLCCKRGRRRTLDEMVMAGWRWSKQGLTLCTRYQFEFQFQFHFQFNLQSIINPIHRTQNNPAHSSLLLFASARDPHTSSQAQGQVSTPTHLTTSPAQPAIKPASRKVQPRLIFRTLSTSSKVKTTQPPPAHGRCWWHSHCLNQRCEAGVRGRRSRIEVIRRAIRR